MMIRYLFMLLLLATDLLASDHCLLYPVSLSDRVQTSDLIIEAEIVRDSVFAEKNMIYTAYQLRVLGTLKGAEFETIQLRLKRDILSEEIGCIVCAFCRTSKHDCIAGRWQSA